jgi:hypothetical protein
MTSLVTRADNLWGAENTHMASLTVNNPLSAEDILKIVELCGGTEITAEHPAPIGSYTLSVSEVRPEVRAQRRSADETRLFVNQELTHAGKETQAPDFSCCFYADNQLCNTRTFHFPSEQAAGQAYVELLAGVEVLGRMQRVEE